MLLLLEQKLQDKDLELYNRFKLVKKLLHYIKEQFQIDIPDNYLLKIIVNYFKNNFSLDDNSFITQIYNFFEKLIDLYKINKFSKYNFLIDEYFENNIINSWLKSKKYTLLGFFDYYLKNNSVRSIKKCIYQNDYFKIFRISHETDFEWITPYTDSSSIVIRFMISGKIYYNDGYLLEDNFYTISGENNSPKKAKVISDSIDLLIIVLSKKFVNNFNIISPTKNILVRSSDSIKNFFNLLDSSFINNYFFTFFELLSFLLQSNGLLKTNLLHFSDTLAESNKLTSIVFTIEDYIKFPSEEIAFILEKELNISLNQINNILLENTNFTLKKTIYKLKIKHILEDFSNSNLPLEELLKHYNLKNVKNFRYNLKSLLNISIKDLKR